MIINIIGDCDKRPVLFTVMKICQTYGDVLLVSNSSRLSRLSDTGDTYGHYQNCMIAITQDGIDDFFETFMYDITDFEYIIVDNIITADADLVIYVAGLTQSSNEKDNLEYIEDYETVELYKGKLIDANTLMRCEEFEATGDMCTIAPKVAEKISGILAKHLNVDPKKIYTVAMTQTSTHMSKVPPLKQNGLRKG